MSWSLIAILLLCGADCFRPIFFLFVLAGSLAVWGTALDVWKLLLLSAVALVSWVSWTTYTLHSLCCESAHYLLWPYGYLKLMLPIKVWILFLLPPRTRPQNRAWGGFRCEGMALFSEGSWSVVCWNDWFVVDGALNNEFKWGFWLSFRTETEPPWFISWWHSSSKLFWSKESWGSLTFLKLKFSCYFIKFWRFDTLPGLMEPTGVLVLWLYYSLCEWKVFLNASILPVLLI